MSIVYTSEDLNSTLRMSVISKRYWYLVIEYLKCSILILQWFTSRSKLCSKPL